MYELIPPKIKRIPSRSVAEYDHSYNFETGQLEAVSNGNSRDIPSYIMSRELVNAVNAALITGRPLLLKGEPGSGKTKVAEAVASHFHKAEALKFYFEWHVKSKSKALEGAYFFDHLSRLRDATFNTQRPGSNDVDAKENPPETDETLGKYIRLGPMGMAFVSVPKKKAKPVVLLIDEIDKGDIDFPNDLLLELDEMRFKIEELDTYIDAKDRLRPLVVITSNDERDLPPAFLRRCLYFKIPPHDDAMMLTIAKSKLKDLREELGLKDEVTLADATIKKMISAYVDQREDLSQAKKPSLSELIDWLKLTIYKVSEGVEVSDVIADEAMKALALIKES